MKSTRNTPAVKKTPAQLKKEALTCLAHVYKDFELLASGDWVPDEDSIWASQNGLKDAVKYLVEAGALPQGSSVSDLADKL